MCGKTTANKCGKCGLVWYCQVSCQRSDWKNHKNVCKYPFEIRESEGKGLGLFATRDLEIGDLIVREDPILHFEAGDAVILQNPDKFKSDYENLKRTEKDRILSLAGAESGVTLANIVIEYHLDSSSRDEEWYLSIFILTVMF